jgi:hypothetical protein
LLAWSFACCCVACCDKVVNCCCTCEVGGCCWDAGCCCGCCEGGRWVKEGTWDTLWLLWLPVKFIYQETNQNV